MAQKIEEYAALLKRDLRAFKPIRTQARRLIAIGCKAGKPWDAAATVGEVARASKVDAVEVVRLIEACGYFMQVDKTPGEPVEEWIIWEDGE